MLEPLDAVGVEPTGDHGGGVHARVIPVENHWWEIISGLFSCKFYTPCAAQTDLVSIRAQRLRRRPQRWWKAPCARFPWEWDGAPNGAPLGVSSQRTQALVLLGSFHVFIFISVKLLLALARSAKQSRTLFIPELCGGGSVSYYFFRLGLAEPSGISG